MNKTKILLIEDDHDLGKLLEIFLTQEGFLVTWKQSGKGIQEEMEKQTPGLCILDIMLPGDDGFTIAKKIRKKYPNLPFIFLTAKKQKEERIKGLQLGADDYITKPFEPEELILRIKNILKRYSITSGTEKIPIGAYHFDKDLLLLKGPGFEKTLTRREADLLLLLHKNKNKLIEKSFILETLWGQDDYFLGRSLDVFISRFRKYFANDTNISIQNVRNVGYIFGVGGE